MNGPEADAMSRKLSLTFLAGAIMLGIVLGVDPLVWFLSPNDKAGRRDAPRRALRILKALAWVMLVYGAGDVATSLLLSTRPDALPTSSAALAVVGLYLLIYTDRRLTEEKATATATPSVAAVAAPADSAESPRPLAEWSHPILGPRGTRYRLPDGTVLYVCGPGFELFGESGIYCLGVDGELKSLEPFPEGVCHWAPTYHPSGWTVRDLTLDEGEPPTDQPAKGQP